MSLSNTSNPLGTVTIINGHEVPLFPSTGSDAPLDAVQTDWIIVKFDRFVDHNFNQELRQANLEVYDHLGDDCYLCKYTPRDLTPIANIQTVSHLALYPNDAVPMAGMDGLTTVELPSNGETQSDQVKATTESLQMPFVLALHPNPSQSPEEVLELVRTSFGAEHLDNEIAGDTIRVNLDPAVIPGVSRIDSVRTIANVRQRTLLSVHQRSIMQFSKSGTSSNYKGRGEIVFVADTGFDMGVADDVHPAFVGRVLAATTATGANVSADWHGHGTHVAGSVLGDLNQNSGSDMYSAQGTAPEAQLISIALNFSKFPTTLNLLRQNVPPYGQPVIMNNSWGNSWDWSQHPYGPDDATIVDQVMDANSDVCIVFAAGNDGRSVGSNGKQQQIGDFASAKNSITVGSSYSDRPLDPTNWKYQAGGKVHSTAEMTVFSSTGPTVEGRIAPDVVAPGAVILSARSRTISPDNLTKALINYGYPNSDNLLFMDGTSMASPAVAGCVAVLRSGFRAQQQKTPTGALLKALIIHGAVDLIGTQFIVVTNTKSGASSNKQYTQTAAPNPFQGYGLVNILPSLLPIIGPITPQRGFIDSSLGSGVQQKISDLFLSTSAKNLTVTLAYTDAAGAALQNRITLSVKLSDGSILNPLPATDPMGRNIAWQASNVAKIVSTKLAAGPAQILLDVQTTRAAVTFAVAWTVT